VDGRDQVEDEVMSELRRVRERIFEEAGGTLEGLYAMLKKLEASESAPVVNLPPRRPEPPNIVVT
jgi:hypothetical protein